ncbi:hypothetical protein T492DRAFT_1149252 [Pavlovales sp. CCMP2436]|nr:hypothetical protein T492DRAFT_1149252 [Pavlovales sp. CCMP2436]
MPMGAGCFALCVVNAGSLMSAAGVGSLRAPTGAPRRGAARPRAAVACGDAEQWTSRPLIAISPEFSQLCQAQFEVLSSTVDAARCAVYFRREHPPTGALEFVPVAVYPQSQSVWVVGQDGDLPAVGPKELPGGFAAPALIPNYPFVRQVEGEFTSNPNIKGEDNGDGYDGQCGLLLPDGGISFPLTADNVVVGVLTIWQSGVRSAATRRRLTRAQDDGVTRQLVREMISQTARAQDLIGPLQALASQLPASRVTELPAGSGQPYRSALPGVVPLLGARQLLWVSDAVGPLASSFAKVATAAGAKLLTQLGEETPPVQASELEVREAVSNLLENALRYGSGLISLSVEAVSEDDDEDGDEGGEGDGYSNDGGYYASDSSPSQAGSASGDKKPYSSVEKRGWLAAGGSMRSAGQSRDNDHGSNGDGYGRRGGGRGIGGESGLLAPSEGVRVLVWNSGAGVPDDEIERIFEAGFRGVRSQLPKARGGSGLGLSIVRELVAGVGGVVSLRNAAAPDWVRARVHPSVAAEELLQRGTVVEIVLPRAPAMPSSRQGRAETQTRRDS